MKVIKSRNCDDFALKSITKHSSCGQSDRMFARKPNKARSQKYLVANPTSTALLQTSFFARIFSLFYFNVPSSSHLVSSVECEKQLLCGMFSVRNNWLFIFDAYKFSVETPSNNECIERSNERKNSVVDDSTKCGLILIWLCGSY